MDDWFVGLLVEPSYNLLKMANWYIERAGIIGLHAADWQLYAVLTAAGFPRLAFLLTDVVDPRDEVDEAIARWKHWVSYVTVEEVEGRKVFSREDYGFLVVMDELRPPSRDDLRLLREEARRGKAEAIARLEVEREIRRLIEMAERGFEGPEMEGFFDRYFRTVVLLKGSYTISATSEEFPSEKLREWAERGLGKLSEHPNGGVWMRIEVKRADRLPPELREREEKEVLEGAREILKETAALLAVARYSGLWGYIFARSGIILFTTGCKEAR